MSSRSGSDSADRNSTRSPAASATLDAVFSALAHPARRRILIVMHARGGEMAAGEINDRFRHSWPTTTRHLGVLKKAGLVEVEERGRQRFYSLRRRDLIDTASWLSAWATEVDDSSRDREEWADLGFATMRNAIPPADSGEEAVADPRRVRSKPGSREESE